MQSNGADDDMLRNGIEGWGC